MTDSNRVRARQFVMQFFSDEELNVLAFDYFPFVYNEFTTGMTKSQKVRLLIEGCEHHGKMPDLLAALKRERPNVYDDHFAVVTATPLPEPKPIQRNPHQIFLSHAHQDADFAQRLTEDLRQQGWEVWIALDSIRPGEKWVEAINRGLAESGVFMLLLTEAAVNSRWVQSETNAAINMEHRGELHFLPVEIESATAPPLWKAYQWVPFQAGYESDLTTLLRELETAMATLFAQSSPAPAQHKKPGQTVIDSPQAIQKSRGSVWTKTLRQLFDGPSVIWKAVVIVLVVVVLLVAFWPDGEQGVEVTPGDNLESLANSTPEITTTATSESAPVALSNPTVTVTQVSNSTATATLNPTPTDMPTTAATAVPTSLPPSQGQLGDTWLRQIDEMTMVFVPGGTFKMGSDPEVDPNARNVEFPQRDVTVDSFWIDRTEVTNAMYTKCVNAGVCNQAEYVTDSSLNGAFYPVVGVSWNDANTYCVWVGAQLPTEAQWEYAARGSDGRIYPWGDETPTCDLVQFGLCSEDTAPVGRTSPAGDSWVGAADMSGNVWEWTADWYDDIYYEYGPSDNPTGPTDGIQKAVRGGSWLNDDRKFLRVATRADGRPTLRNSSTGIRCVSTPDI